MSVNLRIELLQSLAFLCHLQRRRWQQDRFRVRTEQTKDQLEVVRVQEARDNSP